MRASFLDPQGPIFSRIAPYALVALGWLVLLQWPSLTTNGAWAITAASFAALNILRLLPRRKRARDVELTCGPGEIVVKHDARWQRISARSITGASTAATSRGVMLTLSHAKRAYPIVIEVESEAEADQIRRSLGIGHGGFGAIVWGTIPESAQKAGAFGFGGFAFLALLSTLGFVFASSDASALILGLSFLAMTCLFPFAIAGFFPARNASSVVMAADGIQLRTTRGWFRLPYASLVEIRRDKEFLTFMTMWSEHARVICSGTFFGGGLTEAEERSMRAQLLTAAARARGLGRSKDDATGRVDVLRRNNEAPREWLARLDMAGQMLANPSGYRSLSVEPEDLWRTLEDPEAETELRLAALRILRHSHEPKTRVRIDETLAAVHDEATSRRLRIAVQEDIEAASDELAVMDADEARMRARYPRSA